MNLIICGEKCRHQKDGYCSLEGGAQITNALAAPCCYYEPGKAGGSARTDYGTQRPAGFQPNQFQKYGG